MTTSHPSHSTTGACRFYRYSDRFILAGGFALLTLPQFSSHALRPRCNRHGSYLCAGSNYGAL